MEFFNKAKAVRLRSHLGKYLVADDDQQTVRQSRNGSTRKARWTVEFVQGRNHVVRFKSCHGRYLTASDEPFLLGMTGKKVLQTTPPAMKDNSVEWEPIKEGFHVKLRTKGGQFLRANGGTPPWRNSITHDVPQRTVTQNWVLWGVDFVDNDISLLESSESLQSNLSPASSFSSLPEDFSTNSASNTRSQSIISKRSAGSYASTRQNDAGMEFFHRAKAVRLQSHMGKYLVAHDDEETVRQSRNGSAHKARWTVEFVQGNNHAIRLKSCHGRYLTASDEPFLLGMTGKKVVQTIPDTKMDASIEWEPVKEGFGVKLRTREGKFLRANGGTPPWRNSVTHDVPHRTATQSWVLWGVDVVDISISDDSESVLSTSLSTVSSFSSLVDDFTGSPDTGSALIVSERSEHASGSGRQGAMELFRKAQTVRLRSHHDKYLLAEEDQESLCQDRHGSTRRAKWTVEFVQDVDTVIRLKSCYGKYLTATDEQYLLGVTGRKVLQSVPRKLDSSVEWEPIRDGFQVRLKTRYGNYLRANGGLPPWRNSITHDIPHRHSDWILWEVDVVEIRPDSPEPKPMSRADSLESESSSGSFHLRSPKFAKLESSHSFVGSPMKCDGRIIYYNVVDDNGNVDNGIEEPSFSFKGHGLEELTQKLEEETGMENLIVCSRNPLNQKLYPLRLDLPPNNATMHVVVVPASSQAARKFWPETASST
uniref:Actin cross-linking n=2 Tax=Davidia involucrata TaxID=16924 RepID=A0A5B6YXP3_DAVIN